MESPIIYKTETRRKLRLSGNTQLENSQIMPDLQSN